MSGKIAYRSIIAILLGCAFFVSCSKDPDGNVEKEKDSTLTIVSSSSYSYPFLSGIIKAALNTLGSEDPDIDIAGLKAEFDIIDSKISRIDDSIGFKSIDCDVVRYESTGINGEKLELSGKIFVPKQELPLRGIVIVNHGTITDDDEAPSNSSFQIESLMAAMGYAVSISDYIGFGSTKNLPQTYMAEDTTAISSIDLELAAYNYLKGKGYEFEKPDNKVYITGYSQGAAVSLAVQKLIEKNYSGKFSISKTFAGDGPYDLETTYRQVINGNTGLPVSIAALVLIGLDYAENMNTDFSLYFGNKLLDNYKNWYFSKNYSTSEITDQLGTDVLSQAMTPATCNYESEAMKPFVAAFRKNSVVEWSPVAPVWLYHSTTDDYIPLANSENVYDYFKAHSSASVEKDFGDYGSHTEAAAGYYFKVFKGLL
ncbi:MAG: lipase family protein [Bacteroidales bacterium]|jgi:hypothetical protein|nr:lipase family protein [Bacteroidales bacterium]MCI1785633.1 lipase family protein [Bacteroidales bacterium]